MRGCVWRLFAYKFPQAPFYSCSKVSWLFFYFSQLRKEMTVA